MDDKCGVLSIPFDHNGISSERGEFPWVVTIYKEIKFYVLSGRRFICNGHIISDQVIVTAAHCFDHRQEGDEDEQIYSKIVIQTGHYDLKDFFEHRNNRNTPIIKDFVVHPDYKKDVDADIALITLESKIIFTQFIQPLSLWFEEGTGTSEIGTVVGWDFNEEEKNVKLKKIETPIVTQKTCLDSDSLLYNYITSNRTFCAKMRKGTKLMFGYNGAGLAIKKNGKWFLKGVLTVDLYDETKGSEMKSYSVFTDVAKYLRWIKSYVNKLEDCGTTITANPLIHKGNLTTRGEFPWLVVMYVKKTRNLEFQCAGTLISDQIIVTAAHCIHLSEDNILSEHDIVLHVGRFDLDDWADSVSPKIKSIFVHPDYKKDNGPSYDADIAVITLRQDIEFTQFVRPICLWRGKSPESSDLGVVAGWGRDETGVATSKPNKIEMPVVSNKTCVDSKREYQYFVSDRAFCAGRRDGAAPCNGDSGGGFVMKVNGLWYLKGVVSIGLWDEKTKACDVINYSVFTDVVKFLSWIDVFLYKESPFPQWSLRDSTTKPTTEFARKPTTEATGKPTMKPTTESTGLTITENFFLSIFIIFFCIFVFCTIFVFLFYNYHKKE